MKIELTSQSPLQIDTPCLMVGVFENNEFTSSAAEIDQASQKMLSRLIANGDFSGELAQTILLHQVPGLKAQRVLLVGLGKKTGLGGEQFDKAAKAGFASLVKLPITTAACFLEEATLTQENTHDKLKNLAQLAELTNYQFDDFKSQKNTKTHQLKTLYIHTTKGQQAQIDQGLAIAHGINFARQLANMPCNICTPAYLAEQAQKLAKEFASLSIKVLEQADMQALNMGALLAVGQGSANPPKLIELSYQGADSKQAPVVLVGKGITFDTGGISLKPPAGMEDMKFDMGGAASVLGALRAVAELKLPINVIGLVPTAENMPDGAAYRPGDILTSMSGLTIEVVNTDAEGRLILCDALTYAERFKPRAVIDIATLTGAMVISLGYLLNGIFSNQDDLAKALVAAGEKSQDKAWHMPLVEEYQEGLKSHYADMINATKLAGAITAACFLSRFTKNYAWAHIDCAGTAMPADNNRGAGATGRPVALLVEYLSHVSAS